MEASLNVYFSPERKQFNLDLMMETVTAMAQRLLVGARIIGTALVQLQHWILHSREASADQ